MQQAGEPLGAPKPHALPCRSERTSHALAAVCPWLVPEVSWKMPLISGGAEAGFLFWDADFQIREAMSTYFSRYVKRVSFIARNPGNLFPGVRKSGDLIHRLTY